MFLNLQTYVNSYFFAFKGFGCFFVFVFFGATAPGGPGPPNSRGF